MAYCEYRLTRSEALTRIRENYRNIDLGREEVVLDVGGVDVCGLMLNDIWGFDGTAKCMNPALSRGECPRAKRY